MQASNLTTNRFVVDKMMPELVELINSYQPDILWSDGEAG
jgi:alpha-L-fucosidase